MDARFARIGRNVVLGMACHLAEGIWMDWSSVGSYGWIGLRLDDVERMVMDGWSEWISQNGWPVWKKWME
ncbi:hypothetical protein Nepgr_032305 [Nepenthes gracilis]|uniref:Uncharacterized protein n=1 Tax=Nepenthes gracilis TaxID=150966 RepID=A0AAD3Y5J6_NEPGR|nr:hypothetical protein Nepgr_032305 [Nepenthes gracilis]